MSNDNFSRSHTAEVHTPVCIGDLEMYDYKVPLSCLTENVARHLQDHPEVPGVLLTKNGELAGVIPRKQIFERLGRSFGVELFLRKPIIRLKEDLRPEMFILPHHLRVDTAVHQALKRNPERIYDPIVVMADNRDFKLLDVYALLLVQSQILENLNAAMNNLSRMERVVKHESPEVALVTIFDALREVVPFHHASLLMLGQESGAFTGAIQRLVKFPGKLLETNPVYKAIFERQQPISLEDVRILSTWQGVNGSEQVRSWLGVPLADRHGFLGILSLSRYVVSEFSVNEKDMATAFAWYFSQALSDMVRPHADKDFPLQHIKIKKERHKQPVLQALKGIADLTL